MRVTVMSATDNPVDVISMAAEEWRDIEGYEGLYQVSDFGRVRSLDRMVDGPQGPRKIKGKLIKLRNHGAGYKMANLWKDNDYKITYVHALVASAFIPNPSKKLEVNHIDGDKANNHVENLEWCTSKENKIHARDTGLMDKMIISYSKPVIMSLGGVDLAVFASAHEAQKATNISNASVNKCCHGKRNHAGGYQWRFKNAS